MLLDEGVTVQGNSLPELIDVVLASQEQFLLKERRTGRVRRRSTRLPLDQDLSHEISDRLQRDG